MQMVLSFFRHDDVNAIMRCAGLFCLLSLAVMAVLAVFDVVYLYPGI